MGAIHLLILSLNFPVTVQQQLAISYVFETWCTM